jgi:hypothetical protein
MAAIEMATHEARSSVTVLSRATTRASSWQRMGLS